jgi:hypothetical protein
VSWKFGPFTVSSQEIVDVDRVNENFYSVIEEVTGELNEHNWAESAFASDRTLLAEDIAIRVAGNNRTEEPSNLPTRTKVRLGSEWHRIADGLSRTFDSRGGLFWVMASFQIETDQLVGAHFAIEVDGVALGDSLVGSGDMANDLVFSPTGTPLFSFVGPTVWYPYDGGPVVVSALIELGPGIHKLTAVVRNPELFNDGSFTNAMFVANREIIIVELS